jgi:hypothetical protein
MSTLALDLQASGELLAAAGHHHWVEYVVLLVRRHAALTSQWRVVKSNKALGGDALQPPSRPGFSRCDPGGSKERKR